MPKKLPLIEKYRATSFSEIKGQDLAIVETINFYKKFPMKKALILNGSVGVEKTCIALALAKEFDLELFELNASDLRNRLKLDEILKPEGSSASISFFSAFASWILLVSGCVILLRSFYT